MKRTMLFIQPKPADLGPDGKPDPRGLMRFNINSNEVKEMLFADAQRVKCDIHFYKGVAEMFYDHLIAEDRTMEETAYGLVYRWTNAGKKDNHGFDLCVYIWAVRHLHRHELQEFASPKKPKVTEHREPAEQKDGLWNVSRY